MNLYEMNSEYKEILQQVNVFAEENNGEVSEELSSQLDSISSDIENKAENIAVWIKNLNSEAEAIRQEEKKLAERRKRAENLSERLRAYLSAALPSGFKLNVPRAQISWRKSTSINIFDQSLIPEKLCAVKIEPSKALIKDAIQAGEMVPGAELTEKQSIQIK